jgi:hypothetical protein
MQDNAVKGLLRMYEDDHELPTPFIETFTEIYSVAEARQ